MPEGDTILRTAAQLRRVLPGKEIQQQRAQSSTPLAAHQLTGAVVAGIDARGKHLLIHLVDGRTLHSHLGMAGSWHIYPLGDPWRKPLRRASLALLVDGIWVVCFSPKTLELLTPTQLRRHARLAQLGPDVLAPQLDQQQILARFRRHNSVAVGQAVMNQSILCGIGNIYKSETLFLTRVNPFLLVGQLADARVREIVHGARELMHRNLAGYPRRTRFAADANRLWVYRRRGQPCFACATPIQLRRQGDLGRTTYWCPQCQPTA